MDDGNLVAVIIAGGVGTRFWPLSTANRPKQFVRLFGERSLLQGTYDRVASLVPPERILVLTNEGFVGLVREQLPDIPAENIIGEPVRRDTAAAVALAALLCRKRFGNPTMVVLPADHRIDGSEQFVRALLSAARYAARDGALYTFGIKPAYPATGYGYLELGDQVAEDAGISHFLLKSFKEKPDAATAERYIRSGRYLWNSGMFVWTAETFIAALEQHLPEHLQYLKPIVAGDRSPEWRAALRRVFTELPAISVDYGIMERAANVRTVIAPFSWSDIGGWTALESLLGKDDWNNAVRGRVRTLNARNNIVFSEDREETVALVGVTETVVVRSGDKTLVMNKAHAEELKKLVEDLLSETEKGRQGVGAYQSKQCAGVPCFKAYDIRGRVPDELNEELAFSIGRAYAALLRPRRVVVGHDVRLSSPSLTEALVNGLTKSGVTVIDIGLCGTEVVYFATFDLDVDGGIMVTASHNPSDYNGMKFVREKAKPISGDSGLRDIEAMVGAGNPGACSPAVSVPGKTRKVDIYDRYVAHLLKYVALSGLKPFKVLCNAGNGGAGMVIDRLERHLPFCFEKMYFEPDGTFPNGVPNPLLPENRRVTAEAVRKAGADVGIAWDGDYDRCFLFDENGSFIEGYYIVGLLAGQFLKRYPGAKIIHDPRLTWNTIEIVKTAGGIPVQSKTGHAFIKERMRAEDAVYGGEMSAHHYFRDFAYCDSGMIPWLMVLEIMSQTGKKLSELVGERMKLYPISGEINRRVPDPLAAINRIRAKYEKEALRVDETDGISLEFERWRFNLRMSNTEPVVRLNVETRGDRELLEQRTTELLAELDSD